MNENFVCKLCILTVIVNKKIMFIKLNGKKMYMFVLKKVYLQCIITARVKY